MTSNVGPTLQLSPDLCNLIAAFAPLRSLSALALSCKLFRRPAQARLYQHITLTDIHHAVQACSTIAKSEHLGPLVQSFVFFFEMRHGPQLSGASMTVLWTWVGDAIQRMTNVRSILISDCTHANTWMLKRLCPEPPQVIEARLRFAWDANLVAFLATQYKMESLQLYTNEHEVVQGNEGDGPLLDRYRGSGQDAFLPALKTLDTNLAVAEELFAKANPGRFPELTRLQLIHTIKEESQVHPYIEFLPKLYSLRKTLVSLNLTDLPESIVPKVMPLIASTTSGLKHLGVIPLPLYQRHLLWSALLRLPYLTSLEVDLSRWIPPPLGPAQRAIACELRIYAPKLRRLVMWLGHQRWVWALESLDGQGEVVGDAEGRWCLNGPSGRGHEGGWLTV